MHSYLAQTCICSICLLAISALTWSGLMFFLNDQQQRMSRYGLKFSIALAIVSVVILLEVCGAVAREVHTKSTISVWVDHAFQVKMIVVQ